VLALIFLALGFGLAFPYLLFAIFPGWVKILPRPGAWMVTLKKVMAVPLLLTVVWLLWVLDQVAGHGVLVAVILVGAVFLFAALYGVRLQGATTKKQRKKRLIWVSG